MQENTDLPAGAVVDGYIVERKLAAGGMGQIYEVREPGTEQRKALKVIFRQRVAATETPGLAEDRFQREAQVLAKLTELEHPNIIAIHRYARVGDRQYIIMPLFNGIDLHAWVKTNPDLNRVLHVARQLASAVGYAHSHGILHRDIKLSNALISPDDKVKLIDFGLARDADAEEHQLTAVGTTSGTRSYLAPEYISSDIDHDVLTEMWALGVLLYNLVTHRLPFRPPPGAIDDVKIFRAITDGKYTPVRTIRPDCSEAFAGIVQDLLQVDRAKRIKNATALGERLAAIQDAYQPGIAPNGPLPEPTPEKDPTRPGRAQPSQPRQPPVPEATSSEWSPREQGVSSPVSAADAGAIVDDLFAESPAADGPSLDLSLQLPDVTGAFAPPLSVIAPREATRGERRPAPTPPAHEPPSVYEPRVSSPPVGGAASAEPARQEAASETGIRAPRPTFAAANATGAIASTTAGNPALKRLMLPAIAAAAVAGVMVIGWQYAEHTVTVAQASTAFVDPDQLRQDREGQSELQDLKRAKRSAPAPAVLPTPAPALESPPAELPVEPPGPQPVEPPTSPKPAQRRAASTPQVAAAAPPAGPASPWDTYYGGRESFNTPTTSASATASAQTAAAATTAGLRIPVRLDGAIASSPSGPVIALVTQATAFGAMTLPAGTQIHGQTSGTSGPRVLVTFNFAVVDGRQVPLKGIAMAADKRPGIPGTRTLGGASDVAAGGAEGAVRGIVGLAGTIVGDNPGGDAIRGTAGAVGGKAARLNNEEEVLTTQRGARFVVYVGG